MRGFTASQEGVQGRVTAQAPKIVVNIGPIGTKMGASHWGKCTALPSAPHPDKPECRCCVHTASPRTLNKPAALGLR